ncbi:MAG: ABC transporter permease [Bacteroidales bacterium]|jgi:phospholipid/cholesterol/gamma-HCH transport system permease protein|nr:ABC transporter permease [Bacteroidales bacterium]
MRFLYHFGKYYLLVGKAFSKPEKVSIYYRRVLKEIELLGLNSLGIVALISVFIGAVITMQTAYDIENPFIPDYLIGLTARDTMLLEFSSTMIALILAGKVGSSISSEIGTMRVTEQIDALEIMGVNSAAYLILPKIIANVFFFPLLAIMSMVIGVFGGWLVCILLNVISPEDFITGIRYAFIPYYVYYSCVKMVFYAFIISTVPAYHGYYVEGGSLEVGKASTRSVVYCSILILSVDVILTQLLLS